MTEKERLHSLVEDLPEPEVHVALRFVEYLRRETSDPVARALEEAPFDDEPLTAEDLAELEAAERDRQEGRVVSHDEARRELLRES
jgi:predicted transcriptional regulator